MSTHKLSEVELRVAQELKNNREFVYKTNLALQECNNHLKILKAYQENLKAEMGVSKKELQIAFENHSKHTLEVIKDTLQVVSEIRKELYKSLDEFKQVLDKISDFYVPKSFFNLVVQDLKDRQDDLQKQINKVSGHFDSTHKLLSNRIETQASNIRKEIEEAKPIGDPIKDAVVEHLKPFHINFDGLCREISFCKKSIEYGEKKFESIYTLIDKIKGGKA